MAMELKNNVHTESATSMNALSFQYCPQCGQPMKEVDRVNENGSTYVWYDCQSSDCMGSLLRKIRQNI